ncbi:Type III effector HopAA1-1, partial [Pseudomonas syringae pv. maculicola]
TVKLAKTVKDMGGEAITHTGASLRNTVNNLRQRPAREADIEEGGTAASPSEIPFRPMRS